MTIIPVTHDLNKSRYISQYQDLKFYFSSDFYKKKFDTSLDTFIDHECIRLTGKYNVPMDSYNIKKLLSISLYRKIEKRGFKIVGGVKNGKNDQVDRKR